MNLVKILSRTPPVTVLCIFATFTDLKILGNLIFFNEVTFFIADFKFVLARCNGKKQERFSLFFLLFVRIY